MKRFVLACCVLFTLVACRETVPEISDQVSPGGISYTLVHLPDTRDVAFQIAWATDWGTRDDVNQAAPHVGAQLILAGGADGYAPGQANELMVDLNAEASLTASIDTVYGSLIAEKDSLDQVIPIGHAHMTDPTLDPMWFERLRDSIKDAVTQQSQRASDVGFNAVRWSVFGDTAARRALSLDDPRDWETLTVDDIRQWRTETLTRSPQALVVAGDIDASTAGQAIDQLLGELPEGKPVSVTPISADFTPKRILLHMQDAETTHLGFIAPIPPTREGGEMEDLPLIAGLGQGDQSVLFEAVRTELRASYDFGAALANYSREHRFLLMFGAVESEKLAEAETVVRDAYTAFRAEGPKGDVAAQTAGLRAAFKKLPDLPGRTALSVVETKLDGLPPERIFNLMEELDAVSIDSMKARLETAYPTQDDFIVIAVSADETALPGACVITTPAEAVNCP